MSTDERTTLVAQIGATAMGLNDSLRRRYQTIHRRPIIGGPFGAGAFVMASMNDVTHGLDQVTYMVALAEPFFVFAVGQTKADALAMARQMLRAIGDRGAMSIASTYAAKIETEKALERASMLPAETKPRKAPPLVSRKRKRLFEQRGGRCFYCACDLELGGKWHVDRRMPRALGGDNSPDNLALACAGCNLSKGDMTDAEFLAKVRSAA